MENRQDDCTDKSHINILQPVACRGGRWGDGPIHPPSIYTRGGHPHSQGGWYTTSIGRQLWVHLNQGVDLGPISRSWPGYHRLMHATAYRHAIWSQHVLNCHDSCQDASSSCIINVSLFLTRVKNIQYYIFHRSQGEICAISIGQYESKNLQQTRRLLDTM